MIKRLVKLRMFVCIALIVVLSAVQSLMAFAAGNLFVQLPDNVDLNEEFTAEILLSGNPGIMTAVFSVTYNKELLEFVDISYGKILSGMSSEVSDGCVSIKVNMSSHESTVSGTLAELKFKAISCKSDAFITVSAEESYGMNDKSVTIDGSTAVVHFVSGSLDEDLPLDEEIILDDDEIVTAAAESEAEPSQTVTNEVTKSPETQKTAAKSTAAKATQAKTKSETKPEKTTASTKATTVPTTKPATEKTTSVTTKATPPTTETTPEETTSSEPVTTPMSEPTTLLETTTASEATTTERLITSDMTTALHTEDEDYSDEASSSDNEVLLGIEQSSSGDGMSTLDASVNTDDVMKNVATSNTMAVAIIIILLTLCFVVMVEGLKRSRDY